MTEHSSVFNRTDSHRAEKIHEIFKHYENTINELKKMLEQKENYSKNAFDKFVRSENTLEYFKHLLSKDTVEFEIRQLKETIECQSRDLDKEKYYLRNTSAFSQRSKKRKLDERN